MKLSIELLLSFIAVILSCFALYVSYSSSSQEKVVVIAKTKESLISRGLQTTKLMEQVAHNMVNCVTEQPEKDHPYIRQLKRIDVIYNIIRDSIDRLSETPDTTQEGIDQLIVFNWVNREFLVLQDELSHIAELAKSCEPL